jgi:hypothetical protein
LRCSLQLSAISLACARHRALGDNRRLLQRHRGAGISTRRTLGKLFATRTPCLGRSRRHHPIAASRRQVGPRLPATLQSARPLRSGLYCDLGFGRLPLPAYCLRRSTSRAPSTSFVFRFNNRCTRHAASARCSPSPRPAPAPLQDLDLPGSKGISLSTSKDHNKLSLLWW